MAVDLFEPISGGLLKGALEDLREEADDARVRTYDFNNTFYLGHSGAPGTPIGSGTIQYLVQHTGEGITAWSERRRRFSDCGVTNRAAGMLIAPIVGHQITRRADGATDAQMQALAKVYADSRIDSRQRVLAQNQIVCGDAFALIAWSDALQMLLIHSVDPGNIYVIPHPDDPMREGMVIERRNVEGPNDKDASIYWLWTNEQKRLVDDNGEDLDQGDGTRGWAPNPYGVIPYVHYCGMPVSESYWGRSAVSATIEIHRACNNLRSQHDRLILMQAHSLLAISDNQFEAEQIRTGESNSIILSQGGSAAFLAPGADIASIERAYSMGIDEAFAMVGVPVAIIRGTTLPSGVALAVAFQSKTEIVTDLATEYRAAEEEVLRKVCVIGGVHGLPLPADPMPDIDMKIEVYPADLMGAREQARLDVDAGLMTTEDYVTQYILPKGATPESIAEYVAKLDASNAKKAAASNPFGPALPPEQRTSLL